MYRPESYAVGWGTLALINAGIAQGKNQSGLKWFLISLLLGPLATLILVAVCRRRPTKGKNGGHNAGSRPGMHLLWGAMLLAGVSGSDVIAAQVIEKDIVCFIADRVGHSNIKPILLDGTASLNARLERASTLVDPGMLFAKSAVQFKSLVKKEAIIFEGRNGRVYAVLGLIDSGGRIKWQIWDGRSPPYVVDDGHLKTLLPSTLWHLANRTSNLVNLRLADGEVGVSNLVINFGLLPPNAAAAAKLVLTNRDEIPLHIGQIRSSCTCTSTRRVGPNPLGLGESATFRLGVQRGSKSAFLHKVFIRVSRKHGMKQERMEDVLEITLVGNRKQAALIVPTELDFGSVRLGDSSIRMVRVRETLTERIDVTDAFVDGLPCKVHVKKRNYGRIRESSVKVELNTSQLLGGGSQKGTLILSTDSPNRPLIEIPMRVSIVSNVVCYPSVLSFGVVRRGDRKIETLRVTHVATAKPPSAWTIEAPSNCNVETISVSEHETMLRVQARFTEERRLWKGKIRVQIGDENDLMVPCMAYVMSNR